MAHTVWSAPALAMPGWKLRTKAALLQFTPKVGLPLLLVTEYVLAPGGMGNPELEKHEQTAW